MGIGNTLTANLVKEKAFSFPFNLCVCRGAWQNAATALFHDRRAGFSHLPMLFGGNPVRFGLLWIKAYQLRMQEAVSHETVPNGKERGQ